MKQFRVLSVLLGVLFFSAGFAEETVVKADELIIKDITPNQHFVQFGYSIFNFNIDTTVNKDLEVKDSLVFAGMNLNYEVNNNNSWYSNTSFSYAMTDSVFSVKYRDGVELYQHKDYSTLFNLEENIGYNYLINEYNIIPFIGIGIYNIAKFVNDDGFFEMIPYAAAGLRADYNITKDFNMGFKCKLFQAFGAEKAVRGAHDADESVNDFGLEFAASLKWQMDAKWAISIEPYFNKFNFSEKNHLLGAKINMVFNF